MKLNVAFPATGCQKLIEIEDELKVRPFYEKRMATEMAADFLGDEWKVRTLIITEVEMEKFDSAVLYKTVKTFGVVLANGGKSIDSQRLGYIVRISGGNDKQGFPMKQGVLTNGRVKLLLKKGHSCFRPRRKGDRRRRSVRGCIVDSNLSVLNLVIVKKGEKDIPGLTDNSIPRRLGPKRVGKIRKLYNLTKEDDVRQYVIKRPLPQKEGKPQRFKAPKIQRLITPVRLQRKRHLLSLKRKAGEKSRAEAAEYAKLLAKRAKEARELRKRRLSSKRSSTSST